VSRCFVALSNFKLLYILSRTLFVGVISGFHRCVEGMSAFFQCCFSVKLFWLIDLDKNNYATSKIW
jgi:hypothetical protein